MCLVHRGDYSFTIFFWPPNFTIRAWHAVVQKQRSRWAWKVLSITREHHSLGLKFPFKMMDRPIGMERQKFPFTIENILSKYPGGDGDRRPCGTSGSGLTERPVSPAGVHAETVHRACLCCCYCSHCGDIFQTDFIHEGKTKPSHLPFDRVWTLVDGVSSLQPASMDGPQRCSQTPAGRETLTERSRHPIRRTGEPGATAPFSQRSSWTRWKSCSCRISIQMWTQGRNWRRVRTSEKNEWR